MTIGVNATAPLSRGEIQLTSSDPLAPPIIRPNYLDNELDLQTMIEGVELAREIANTNPLTNIITDELLPGSRRDNHAKIAKSIARYSQTLYHPCGTCAMGRDKTSVCDEQFRVRGIEALQIIDASVLPLIPTGNPSVMLLMLSMLAESYE